MISKRTMIVALVAVIALGAGVAVAQTTYEVKQGTVLHVDGNLLTVQMSTGEVKQFDVPSDFQFDVDGQKVTVDQLKPGTKLTSTVAYNTVVEEIKTKEIRNAEIVQRKGQTVIYRDEENKLHMVTGIPEGFIVFRDGKPVPIEALAGGDKVTAVLVHTEERIVTESDIQVAGSAPAAPKPAPAPAPVAAPAPAPAPVLPKTGSSLPLVGLAGLMALALGLGIAVIRRF